MGKGTAHIIIFTAARRHQFLKLRHNAVITAVACIIHPQAVVNLFAAVQTQHDIAHFFVGKVDHIIIDQHAICRQCKAELFVVNGFLCAGIGNELFYHIPVHQRLAAKKINFQIGARAGVFN
ncbi:hypothetical protein SDC9_175925 [bioreactor metagenome]|uniref:Uncharacterized protein n=1 Tax=bioreactor metagenome TaxID=1076179 RepID=A0A645GXX0_9ZZZZ